MKKFILLLSVTLIWGCSQANEADTNEQVKSKAEQVTQSVQETAQQETTEIVNEKVAEVSEQAVEEAKEMAKETVQEVADKVAATTAVADPAADYQAGIHYNVITPAWDTGSDEVIIYEFFSYMCTHCNSFQPYMTQLEATLPEGVKVQRVPVVFYPQWRPHAQAFYTFEAMNILEQAHAPFFAAIHQHKKQFRSIDEIADWVSSSFNIDRDKFLSTANSFMVDGQLRKGMQMMQAMNITSTPTLIVNGKFMPNKDQMRTRDYIIKLARALALKEAQ